MSNTVNKYTSEEILQIQIDFYNFQSVFDPEVAVGEKLTFDTLIVDWCNICDLLGPKELSAYYNQLFELDQSVSQLEGILSSNINTLKDFCDYVSIHACRQKINPIVTLGASCMTAAIFKTLMANLENKGIKTSNIRPSTEFVPLFLKHGSALVETVNKLAPGSLTEFACRDSNVSRVGRTITLLSIFGTLAISTIWHFQWMFLASILVGILMMIIGNKLEPKTMVIGGYDTMRDLVLGIQTRLKNN